MFIWWFQKEVSSLHIILSLTQLIFLTNSLQDSIQDFNRGLNENKKESQLLRSDLATFEHKATEQNNDTLKEIMEDIANLEKDFRKLQAMDINEVAFLKQQVGQLVNEKMKIEQSNVLLSTRINALEHDVGFE